MKRWLMLAACALGLCACEATETGNPDPSHDRDGGAPPGADAGVVTDGGFEPPPPFDAGVSEPPPGQDGGSAADAGAVNDEDAGEEEDGGT